MRFSVIKLYCAFPFLFSRCVQIYELFVEGGWCETTQFANDFLPNLIVLCSDKVPNIRVIATKALLVFMKTGLKFTSQYIYSKHYTNTAQSKCFEFLSFIKFNKMCQ